MLELTPTLGKSTRNIFDLELDARRFRAESRVPVLQHSCWIIRFWTLSGSLWYAFGVPFISNYIFMEEFHAKVFWILRLADLAFHQKEFFMFAYNFTAFPIAFLRMETRTMVISAGPGPSEQKRGRNVNNWFFNLTYLKFPGSTLLRISK